MGFLGGEPPVPTNTQMQTIRAFLYCKELFRGRYNVRSASFPGPLLFFQIPTSVSRYLTTTKVVVIDTCRSVFNKSSSRFVPQWIFDDPFIDHLQL